MSHGRQFLLLFAAVTVALAQESGNSDLKRELKSYQNVVEGLSRQVRLQQLSTEERLQALTTRMENEEKKYQSILDGLTQQLMMQQLAMEESMMAGGNSGIRQARNMKIGTRSYFSATHTNGRSAFNVHDHSQNIQTVGMGEVVVVINGVEFRTRHNDYPLRQPHPTENTYHKTEEIEYPPVPPSVLKLKEIDEQVAEMKKYFKAWKDQDTSEVDYRPYFKSLMCYLEGAWTLVGEEIEEPFQSDRHFVDAKTWWGLSEKIRFMSYAGSKDNSENYAFLPKKIMYWMNNGTEPVWAQWNYRILCSPVPDIPTRYLKPIDDLSSRREKEESLDAYATTRRARFFLHDYKNLDVDRACHYCYIDSLMEQVPGKDNYKGNLTDTVFGNLAVRGGGEDRGKVLNTAYYHRYFKSNKKGANGVVHRIRGFSDGLLYMAQTSHEKIPSLSITDCKEGVCTDYVQRWTYAIPLEIIYLTPIYNWNPYNIYTARRPKDPKWNAVTRAGRNGGFTANKAYDGNRNNVFYRTPEELFMGSKEVEKDPADTSKGVVGVLDPEGNVRRVVASGTRIFLPEMPGVGTLRTRYPIAPIYNEGSQIYKELEVLKDLVLRKESFKHMYYDKSSEGSDGSADPMIEFEMALSTRVPPGLHTHQVDIPKSEVDRLMSDKKATYEVDSEEETGHAHSLVISYDNRKKAKHPWVIKSCDDKPTCWDEHPLYLERKD